MYLKTVLAFLLVCCVLIGCSSSSTSLSISPSKVNFTDVNIGDSENRTLVLKNNSSDVITVIDLNIDNSSEFAVTGTTTSFDIQKGEEYNLTITFSPLTGGKIEGLLEIQYSATTNVKVVKLYGTGVPVARISMSDSSYDYNMVLNGNTKDKIFEFENTGSDSLYIDLLNITGTDSSLFTIISGGSLPINIIPNAKHQLTVKFAPVATGNFSAAIQIHHNAVNENEYLSIPLSGTGSNIDAQILLSRSTPWDFGSVATALPSVQFVEIDNSGTDPLTLSSATLTNNNEYTVYSLLDHNGAVVSFPYDVPVGSYALLRIEFAPSAKTMFNDTLSIFHNGHNENSPYNIGLTGTGRDIQTKTFNYSGSIENWVVPNDVSMIRIEVWGAQGGSASVAIGGKGARMKGDFMVNPGDIIKVLVGEKGDDAPLPTTRGYSAGGGGGAYVATSTNNPLICAGGGGGSGAMHSSPVYLAEGDDGTTAIDGTVGKSNMPNGTNGNGAPNQTNTGASGGAGFYTNSQAYPTPNYATEAYAFVNGGAGATQGTCGGNGGFGGGGAGCYGGGGGGGYSGGAHGDFHNTSDEGAGGGGSINNGINQDNTGGVQTGNGKIVFSY